MGPWLVYVWFRPNGSPLYVGIGKRRKEGSRQRWEDHIVNSGNVHLANAFIKYGGNIPLVVIREDLSRKEADAIEISLIQTIGRRDLGLGPLANLTDGGDGCNGYIETAEQKQRRSLKIKEAHTRPEVKERHRKSVREALSQPDVKERQSAAIRDALKTPEQQQRLSKNARDMWNCLSPEEKVARLLKTSTKAQGKRRTPEQRARISEGTRKAMAELPPEVKQRMVAVVYRPEVRLKMSESAKARLQTLEQRSASVARLNTPEAVSKRYTPERAAKIADLTWITDGIRNARIHLSTTPVPRDWRFGRAPNPNRGVP